MLILMIVMSSLFLETVSYKHILCVSVCCVFIFCYTLMSLLQGVFRSYTTYPVI